MRFPAPGRWARGGTLGYGMGTGTMTGTGIWDCDRERTGIRDGTGTGTVTGKSSSVHIWNSDIHFSFRLSCGYGRGQVGLYQYSQFKWRTLSLFLYHKAFC